MDFYPAVTTSDEIVELQQNVCYMTTKGDKQQEYKLFANNTLNIYNQLHDVVYLFCTTVIECTYIHMVTHQDQWSMH